MVAAHQHDPACDFQVTDLDYEFPPELIAQHPVEPRDAARLLFVDRTAGTWQDARVRDLPDYLREGDLLVLNDTRVLPARFEARRKTGGHVTGLFLEEVSVGRWRVMLRGSHRLREGERLVCAAHDGTRVGVTLEQHEGGGQWLISPDLSGPAPEVLARIGDTPLPPYIRKGIAQRGDAARYQTVFARHPGAVAAPTAGLHLTERLLQSLRARGVETAFVTLHVGAGTFKPIRAASIREHEIHTERYELSSEAVDAVARCRSRSGRVVAVGTTVVRVLETRAAEAPGAVTPGSGLTSLFIHPPYRFRVVDAMLTNFHWPRSTLLALVMAYAGVDLIRRAYGHAVGEKYRLFSYGDAMFIA